MKWTDDRYRPAGARPVILTTISGLCLCPQRQLDPGGRI